MGDVSVISSVFMVLKWWLYRQVHNDGRGQCLVRSFDVPINSSRQLNFCRPGGRSQSFKGGLDGKVDGLNITDRCISGGSKRNWEAKRLEPKTSVVEGEGTDSFQREKSEVRMGLVEWNSHKFVCDSNS